jgi:hypothetical protein
LKALLWNYKYADMLESWYKQTHWIVNSLIKLGIEVRKHPSFICKGLDFLPQYSYQNDKDAEICIYNHADLSHLTGDIFPAKINLFFKPTVPDKWHTTLDELGYGPYSSITYQKPDFEKVSQEEVKEFFDAKVINWIDNKETKWGKYFENKETEVNLKDYFLVLGQCDGDEVVTRHDFGSYLTKLFAIVRELDRVSDNLIIVKLHPYMNGMDNKSNLAEKVERKLSEISKKVKVFNGRTNVHNFIKNAKCVLLANSGAGFETMMHHKPIISWGYPEYHWVTYDLRHLADLKNAIKLDWFNKESQDKFLYWYLEKYCFYNQETCDNRMREILNARL